MKKTLLIVFVLFLAASIGYSQVTTKTLDKRHHAFSGTLLFGAEAGATLGFTDYSNIHPQIIGRGLLEYFFPTTSSGIFGLRGFYSAGYVGGKDDNRDPQQFRATMTSIGGGITYNFSIADAVFPYIFLGASYSWVNPQDNTGFELPYNQNKTASARNFDIEGEIYIAEVGMRFLLSRDISLNASVGDHFSRNDNWDAVPQGGSNDMMLAFMLGFSYSLFSDYDSDGDGVPDSKDQCPDTPTGVKVDEFGCPIDSDNDGVPDYLDKCPKTPSGVAVDEAGCPLDADGDGVPDYLDKCPNTPKGAPVNERGCPDSDGDGVFDDIDECPDTPKGAPVDAKGCPKDTDGDGVPDYLDECPNTPKGTEVDSKGCPKVDTVVTEITLSGDTNFEFNKSTLLPSAYDQLNPLAESMKKNPKTRWRIEGHTDGIGSDSYNMELSRQRAESVANYLVQQGVERNRLEIVPLGKSQPKATNDTQEGRAMNRRVEIKLIK
jgi:OmpA-OmpF porin, OOP family